MNVCMFLCTCYVVNTWSPMYISSISCAPRLGSTHASHCGGGSEYLHGLCWYTKLEAHLIILIPPSTAQRFQWLYIKKKLRVHPRVQFIQWGAKCKPQSRPMTTEGSWFCVLEPVWIRCNIWSNQIWIEPVLNPSQLIQVGLH